MDIQEILKNAVNEAKVEFQDRTPTNEELQEFAGDFTIDNQVESLYDDVLDELRKVYPIDLYEEVDEICTECHDPDCEGCNE